MAETLNEFLSELATEPSRLADFMRDPEGQMEAAGLGEQDKFALRSGLPYVVAARLSGASLEDAFSLSLQIPPLVPQLALFPQLQVLGLLQPPPQQVQPPPNVVAPPPPNFVAPPPPPNVVSPPPQFIFPPPVVTPPQFVFPPPVVTPPQFVFPPPPQFVFPPPVVTPPQFVFAPPP